MILRGVRLARWTTGFLMVFAACSGTALAQRVPEVDPGTASSALALLVGGLFLVTNPLRRAKK